MVKIVPIDMYKTMIGWAEYESGDKKHEATHKLMSAEDWFTISNYIAGLKHRITTQDNQLTHKDEEISRIKANHDCELSEIQRKSTENIAELQNEVERQKRLNENLLRITRERSNAQRGIQPKKKHCGYRFIGKITQIKVVKEHTKKEGNLYGIAWTATLETPYDVTIPLEQIKNQIDNDLFGSGNLCAKMNIYTLTYYDNEGKMNVWRGDYKEAISNLKEGDMRTYLYDYRYSSNSLTRLWEVSIYTTGVICVPPDLL